MFLRYQLNCIKVWGSWHLYYIDPFLNEYPFIQVFNILKYSFSLQLFVEFIPVYFIFFLAFGNSIFLKYRQNDIKVIYYSYILITQGFFKIVIFQVSEKCQFTKVF